MTIIEAIKDRNLFRPFLGDDLTTWRPWLSFLRVVYGLPTRPTDSKLIHDCTGRDPSKLPSDGFGRVCCLTGRRSGKSRTAAMIGAYEAVLAGHEGKLAPGERGLVALCAPTKQQADVEHRYMRALFGSELLCNEVVRETTTGFELRNGIGIEVLAGDYRSIRNFTLIAAVISEAAFFGLDENSKIRNDTELIRAIRPGLATTGGKLIAISSPYAKRGWCWRMFKQNHANNTGRTLVWNCPSRTMNPTLPQELVDEALQDDLQAAKSEYLAEFRDDVAIFIPRDAIERLVVPGRVELMPRERVRYYGFADLSGGRVDDAALAIAHKDNAKVILDRLVRWTPPFNPNLVIQEMARELRRFGLRHVIGDNYSAEFVASAFRSVGIGYTKSPQPKAELYRELLPLVFSDGIELLDDPVLIDQLSNLERRTRSGGKDIIDHPAGSKDDLANSVAGVAVNVTKRRIEIGALRLFDSPGARNLNAWREMSNLQVIG